MTLDKRWEEATVIVGAGSALEWEWIRYRDFGWLENSRRDCGVGCDGKPVQLDERT